MNCPICGKAIADSATNCTACGESREPAPEPQPASKGLRRGGKPLVFVAAGLLVAAVVLVLLARPYYLDNMAYRRSRAAMQTMKRIWSAQFKHIKSQEETQEPGKGRYGTLAELAEAGLIDAELASGTLGGYVFATGPSTTEPGFEYWITASPVDKSSSRARHYATNRYGQGQFWWHAKPIRMDPETCEPADKDVKQVDMSW